MKKTGAFSEVPIQSFRCIDLFDMKSLQGLKLLAGEAGVHNTISRVNIMEVPDIQNWAQSNEFLITTGYSYHDHIEAFLELIPKLAELGIAALAIKTKRFIHEIPESIIACAEAYSLPLFELAESTIFSNVVREVMEHIISFETHNILLLQERLEQLANIMLHGYEMPQILQELSGMINNPVCVLDAFHQLITPASQMGFFDPLKVQLQHFDARSSPHYSQMTASLNEQALPQHIQLHIFNLWESEKDPVLVVIAEESRSCSELDLATVARVLPLLNLRLGDNNTYKLVKAKYFDDFLKDWLTGCITSAEDLNMKGRLYGYNALSTYSYRIVIVRFHHNNQSIPDATIISSLNRINQPSASLFTTVAGTLVALLPQATAHLSHEDTDKLQKQLSELCNTTAFSLCIGELNPPLFIHKGYADAQNLYTCACISKSTEKIITWEQIGIYSILTLIPKHNNVTKFLQRYIQPLVEHDLKSHSSLIQTLSIYFQTGCNIKLTANAMYTHYNTIVYRLDKIKTLLNITFDNADTRLQIQLGLKLYEMEE